MKSKSLASSVFRRAFGVLCATVFLFSTALVFAQEQQPPPITQAEAITPELKTTILAAIDSTLTRRAYASGVDFSKWGTHLEKHKELIDKANDHTSFTNAVNRALREFGISHVRFASPRATLQRNTGRTTGFGLRTKKVDDGLEVISVQPESPAAEARLEQGDILLEVDGAKAETTLDLAPVSGQTLKLKVKKRGGDTVDIELTSKSFSIVPKPKLEWHNSETAYLRLPTFSNGYERDEMEKLLTEAMPAKRLIIDLRSNGGGRVASMLHFLSILLPDGSPVVTRVTKQIAEKYALETGGDPTNVLDVAKWSGSTSKTRKLSIGPFNGKIAVLINRGSASASEEAAVALKANGRAILLGSRTAGAVLTSLFARMPGGFSLQYPIQDCVSPFGTRFEGNPVLPDIEVPANASREELIAKAIEALDTK